MLTLIAALMLQSLPPIERGPDDVPGAVASVLRSCRQSQEHHRDNLDGPYLGVTGGSQRARNGDEVLFQQDAHGCALQSRNWRPDGDRMALAVERALAAWREGFTRSTWRDPEASERGPSVWTTFDQRDANGRVVGTLELIEPADGAIGEVSITYHRLAP